jgi:hypothetical protein
MSNKKPTLIAYTVKDRGEGKTSGRGSGQPGPTAPAMA